MPQLRGANQDVLAFQAQDDDLTTGSIPSQFVVSSSYQRTMDRAVISVATTKRTLNDTASSAGLLANSLSSTPEVNRSTKGDRRIEWHWEPFRVTHGRREVALNWSGSVWSMTGPFTLATNIELPKAAFAPSDDLKLVMADASQFLLPEPIAQAPDVLFARNETQGQSPATPTNSLGASGQGTALAYAPNAASGLEDPFNVILTEEQRKGRIHEDNQVTILGAVEELNKELDGETTPEKASKPAAQSIPATIATLPRPRAPREDSKALAKVSQPLDVNPVVSALEKKAEAKIEQPVVATKRQTKEGPTLAKSKAVRAELQLASISGDKATAKKKKSPFASWFNFSKKKPKKAKIDARGEHAWVTNPLPKSSFSKKQKTCLANAIYFESRSEPVDGQVAVAQVVINRVKNPTYPNTICGVVYQNKHRRNACQFSFACDRIPDRIRSKKAWDLAWKISNQVVNGEVWMKSIGSSTHYHATYVRPRWARTMKRLKKIGLHIFYKTYGGGWS